MKQTPRVVRFGSLLLHTAANEMSAETKTSKSFALIANALAENVVN